MRTILISIGIPAAVAVGMAAVLVVWLTPDPAVSVQMRLPVETVEEAEGPGREVRTNLAGTLRTGPGEPADIPGSWPMFRGAELDNIVKESIAAPEKIAADRKVLWARTFGEGHAGVAIRDGRVYLLDYDMESQGDVMRCMSLADGRDIWTYFYPVKIERQHGISRTVPALYRDVVVGLGPFCHVTALDAETGEFRWGYDLEADFGTEIPKWYAGECPLIDQGRAILGIGGDEVLMMAVDAETGQEVWRTPNEPGWGMTHSSIIPVTVAGRKMYVWCAGGGVVAVDAETGEILASNDEWYIRIAMVPTPVDLGDGRLFVSGGYRAGSAFLEIRPDGEGFSMEMTKRMPDTTFGSEQHTPILWKGHLYGVRADERMVCLDLEANVLWTSGAKRFGIAPFMMTDEGVIVASNDLGRLTFIQATPDGYQELAECHPLDGANCWAPMALAGGRLIYRGEEKMICLDVSGE